MLSEIVKITIPDWVTTKWLVEGAATVVVPFIILGYYLFRMIKEEKSHAAEFSPKKEEKKAAGHMPKKTENTSGTVEPVVYKAFQCGDLQIVLPVSPLRLCDAAMNEMGLDWSMLGPPNVPVPSNVEEKGEYVS